MQVLDYTQFYLNLTEANLSGRAEWRIAYNFTRLYGMADVSAIGLNNIASAMLSHPAVFHKYYSMNHMLRDQLPYCGILCQQVHYCATTQIDYSDYDDCITRALLARQDAADRTPCFLHLMIDLLVLAVVSVSATRL